MRRETDYEDARRQDHKTVRQQLFPDESLIWTGRPGKRGIRGILNFQTLFLLAFSAVWISGVLIGSVSVAVTVIAEVISGESGLASLLTLLIFIPFYFGACLLILTVVHTLTGGGSNVIYALTDRRVMILKVRKNRVKCTAYQFSALSGMRLETGKDGVGTIFFPQNGIQQEKDSGLGDRKWDSCFFNIPDVHRVYQMISDGTMR